MFSTPLVHKSFSSTNATAGIQVQYNYMVVTDFSKNPFPSFECGEMVDKDHAAILDQMYIHHLCLQFPLYAPQFTGAAWAYFKGSLQQYSWR